MNSMYFWAFSIPSAISWRNCTSADASSGFTSASPPNRGILIPSAISPSLSFALSTSVPKNDSSSSGGPSPFSAFIASRRSFPFLSASSSAALRARASVGKFESLRSAQTLRISLMVVFLAIDDRGFMGAAGSFFAQNSETGITTPPSAYQSNPVEHFAEVVFQLRLVDLHRRLLVAKDHLTDLRLQTGLVGLELIDGRLDVCAFLR